MKILILPQERLPVEYESKRHHYKSKLFKFSSHTSFSLMYLDLHKETCIAFVLLCCGIGLLRLHLIFYKAGLRVDTDEHCNQRILFSRCMQCAVEGFERLSL